ncbi:hypothetical protein N7E81_07730 [Reichenbachiella carrageenanivorans]|uniref:Carbohydrate-binding domain-containing protein n=1 Tax=Reichenbachiella carrageenanivorans TaxID=2979869 RepID=A0ABY6D4A1_9BACT|nr:sugar-binding protein [Reichenbachiella carrageenanivorans]UXX80987.1 hypothetical protein N7E81_07730 [Reichenbachiella carrageenanivorans]
MKKLSIGLIVMVVHAITIKAQNIGSNMDALANKAYMVRCAGDSVKLARAEILDDFNFPWREETPPPTRFRAVYDEIYFYFQYDVVDPKICLSRTLGDERDVIKSDRVEIFFIANNDMYPYYCLELDAGGLLLDYEVSFPNYIRTNGNGLEKG